ncbi:MAG: alpha/beta hydrolase [Oceanicaulis sp.]
MFAALCLMTALALTSGQPAQTPGAVAQGWSEELPVVFRELRARPEAEFIREWGAAYDRYQARLEAAIAQQNLDRAAADRLRQRLLYEWARGRAAWPEQHAQAVRDPDFQESAAYWDFIDVVELDRADLLDLPEYAAFLLGRLHARRDALIEAERVTLDPEAVRLTAELAEAGRAEQAAISCFYVHRAVSDHLDDHGADGWPEAAGAALDACPGEQSDALRAELAEARAERQGHRIEIYKTAGPVSLEAHVFPAVSSGEAEAAPALVWFHGGGWYQGSWAWCGVCEIFKEAGYTVVQVEYRLGARHGTGIAEAVEDAADAVAWVRENADTLNVDAARVYAGGFSAGGHLALTTALLQPAGAPGRPDAAVGVSACTDLTSSYWTLERAGGAQAAAALSPVTADPAGAPPVVLVQAMDDRLCPHAPAADLIGGLRAGGARAELVSLEDGGHFGLYRDREAYERARDAVLAFLGE